MYIHSPLFDFCSCGPVWMCTEIWTAYLQPSITCSYEHAWDRPLKAVSLFSTLQFPLGEPLVFVRILSFHTNFEWLLLLLVFLQMTTHDLVFFLRIFVVVSFLSINEEKSYQMLNMPRKNLKLLFVCCRPHCHCVSQIFLWFCIGNLQRHRK